MHGVDIVIRGFRLADWYFVEGRPLTTLQKEKIN